MISACLLGMRCRYDGLSKDSIDLIRYAAAARFIPFCPEQMGGLPTPRPAAAIVGGDGRDVLAGTGRVVDTAGHDVTAAFMRGAEEALKLARLSGARVALLKDKSPSCGIQTPHCQKACGFGMGVAAALLDQAGIRILDLSPDDDFPSPGFRAILEGERRHRIRRARA